MAVVCDTLCHADVLLRSLVESLRQYAAADRLLTVADKPLSPLVFQLHVAAAGQHATDGDGHLSPARETRLATRRARDRVRRRERLATETAEERETRLSRRQTYDRAPACRGQHATDGDGHLSPLVFQLHVAAADQHATDGDGHLSPLVFQLPVVRHVLLYRRFGVGTGVSLSLRRSL